MGREYQHREKPRGSDSWLEQRRVLMRAYGSRGFRDHAVAAQLHAALESAVDGGSRQPLLAALWSMRRAAPHWTGVAALDGARLVFVFAKKLRRARRESAAAENPSRQQ
jgi:hypothetical protein